MDRIGSNDVAWFVIKKKKLLNQIIGLFSQKAKLNWFDFNSSFSQLDGLIGFDWSE